MNKKEIPFLVDKLNELFPNARTELDYNNEFQLLVAIILSAQTTDKQVNKATEKLFEVLKTPLDWKKLWQEEIKKYIRTLGFFNNKSINVYKTSCILADELDSSIPKKIEDLIKLPWVWIKTAKVFLALVEDAPYIWVDTHVHRVLNRLWLVKTKSPLETDKHISKNFSVEDHAGLHHTLVLFGRYICVARKPKCEKCPFVEKCNYYQKSIKKD